MPWDEILGQEFGKRILQNSLRMNRPHHAYLFYGPDGVGKTLTSMAFAQAINCERAQGEGCGACSQCRLIKTQTHPDVMIVDPPGDSFSIDEVRRIKKSLHYRPVMGREKLYILVGVERMGLPAANSMLIILEDPPSRTIFILTTKDPDTLPSTIISRCQTIPFTPIPRPAMVSLLVGWGLDEREADHLAILSEGIPSKAKMYMDEDLFRLEEEVSLWIERINKGRPIDLLNLSEDISSMDRAKIIRMLDILLYVLRDLLEGRVLLLAMDAVHRAQSRIQRYGNLQLCLEVMFLELYRLRGSQYA